MSQVAITGNAYPVKDALKAMGARWNADAKTWMIAADKLEAAQKLVVAAPVPVAGTCSKCKRPCNAPYTLCFDCRPAPTSCKVCGVKQTRNSRGYTENKIMRSGECFDCYEERKMGY